MRFLEYPYLCLHVAVILFVALTPQPCFAEPWPTLDDYVAKCVLIVKAKTIIEQDGTLTFRVTETWKGRYEPQDFVRTTEDGRFFASQHEHGVDVVDGQEIVFFFTRHNQPIEGKLSRHSTAFPIRDGELTYAGTSDWLSQEFTVHEFKKRILDIVTGVEVKIVPMPRVTERDNGWKYTAGLSEPEWSPDSKMIAFTRQLNKYMERYKTWHGKQEIWITSVDGKDVKQLAEGRKLFWSKPDTLAYVYWTQEDERIVTHFALIHVKTGVSTDLDNKPPFPKIRFKWNNEIYSILDTKTFFERRADEGRNRLYKRFEKQGRELGFGLDDIELRKGIMLMSKSYIKADGGGGTDIVHMTSDDLTKAELIVRNASQPSLSHDGRRLAFVRDGALWVRHFERPLQPVVVELDVK